MNLNITHLLIKNKYSQLFLMPPPPSHPQCEQIGYLIHIAFVPGHFQIDFVNRPCTISDQSFLCKQSDLTIVNT